MVSDGRISVNKYKVYVLYGLVVGVFFSFLRGQSEGVRISGPRTPDIDPHQEELGLRMVDFSVQKTGSVGRVCGLYVTTWSRSYCDYS